MKASALFLLLASGFNVVSGFTPSSTFAPVSFFGESRSPAGKARLSHRSLQCVAPHIECVCSRPQETPRPIKPVAEAQKALTGAFAAFTIASSVFTNAIPPADAYLPTSFGSSSQLVAEKVIREGIYGEYEVDLPDQVYDDARSTFKPAKETKSKKGKYTALLAVLIVGSFVIPMAQYFWYVKDDDSSNKFFAQNVPPPPTEKPKKKGWF